MPDFSSFPLATGTQDHLIGATRSPDVAHFQELGDRIDYLRGLVLAPAPVRDRNGPLRISDWRADIASLVNTNRFRVSIADPTLYTTGTSVPGTSTNIFSAAFGDGSITWRGEPTGPFSPQVIDDLWRVLAILEFYQYPLTGILYAFILRGEGPIGSRMDANSRILPEDFAVSIASHQAVIASDPSTVSWNLVSSNASIVAAQFGTNIQSYGNATITATRYTIGALGADAIEATALSTVIVQVFGANVTIGNIQNSNTYGDILAHLAPAEEYASLPTLVSDGLGGYTQASLKSRFLAALDFDWASVGLRNTVGGTISAQMEKSNSDTTNRAFISTATFIPNSVIYAFVQPRVASQNIEFPLSGYIQGSGLTPGRLISQFWSLFTDAIAVKQI